ncbi:MAG: phage holin family protein [Limnobacter sp.]|nr:phage holin family protein [Limnobacter sp.]
MRLLASWLLHAAALMAVAYLLPGVTVDSFTSALWAALILGLINTFIKPILTLLTLPLTVITLGIFYFILNGLMFYWAGSIVDGFRVDGVLWAVLASLLYSLVTSVLMNLLLTPPVKIERLS